MGVYDNRTPGDMQAAKVRVATEYPSICGACATGITTSTATVAPPSSTTTTSSSVALCDVGGAVWSADADGYTCGSRIQWVYDNQTPGDLQAAKAKVAQEYPNICGACANVAATPSTTSVASLRCSGLQNVKKQCSTNGCRVLAGGMTGRTCQEYCSSQGYSCTGAWEEQNNNCIVSITMTCDQVWQGTSDLLCECGPSRRLSLYQHEDLIV